MLERQAPAATHTLGDDSFALTFAAAPEGATALASVRLGGITHVVHQVPVLQILTAGSGHVPASSRLAHTEIGARLRAAAVEQRTSPDGTTRSLQLTEVTEGIRAGLRLTQLTGQQAVRAEVTVTNTGETAIVLRSVASWTAGFSRAEGDDVLHGWRFTAGRSDWLGEGRWTTQPLRGPEFPRLAEHLTGHNPRGSLTQVSTGTWSTGHHIPVGVLENPDDQIAVAWQIEHNGAWRAEIGEDTRGGYLSLSGPTDADSAWSHVLEPGESYTSVPVALAWGTDATAALSALTAYRRAARRPHVDNDTMPVVFNDYMNTLNGDPTTEKLLPLIAAAAEVGAEVFCIDAGWYDDSGHWWDSVGAWLPSTTRFPGGLGEVIDAIRAAGMVPGLWLEPEVVGINSPVADTLPAEAFLQRNGQRVVEHYRYHLDLRHPAAIAHLDEVVDRLVEQFGIGFFKLDYNINPGVGTDLDSDSVGDGLLQHNRAHLAWLDAVLERHPRLILENCSSGAMRSDFAILSRVAMQSTSDQQDFTKYPPIAAAAALSMLPEQAASWAYPQPEMTDEEVAFSLATGLLGRFYVSGHLNNMTPAQREQVTSAIAVAKQLAPQIRAADPFWPLGLPGWDDPWVAAGLRSGDTDLVTVWRRGADTETSLQLPHRIGQPLDITTIFPTDLPGWDTSWDAATGTLNVRAAATPSVAARTLRLTSHPRE